MSFEDLTFSWHISTGYAGCGHKDTLKVSDHFNEAEWNTLTEKEKDEWLWDYLETEMSNRIDANIWIDD